MDVQRDLGFASYGAPHLNIRTPFEYEGSEAELMSAVDRTVRGLPPFDVRFRAWRRFPHTIFLELERAPLLMEAHARALRELPAPGTTRDADGFLPHLTLALGLCDWAEDNAWEAVKPLVPPVLTWTVGAVALTLEARGEILELARYVLREPGGSGALPLVSDAGA